MPGRTLARVRGVFAAEGPRRLPVLRAALVLTTGLALAACSNSSSATTTTTDSPATVLFNAGLTAEQHGGYRQATNDFGGVLQLQPRSYLADYDLGVADAALKRTSAAKAAYGRAIAIAPSFRSALYNLALLDSTADPDQAVPLFIKLETIDPGDPNVEYNYGLLLERTGRVKAGEAQLGAAIKAEPSLRTDLPKGTILPPGA